MATKGQPVVQPAYAGPLYFQINELLVERIRSRSWAIGSALPNETDLAREYGVSVGTMRKALQRLESMGWISRRRGRGTFVSDPLHVLMEKMSSFYVRGRRIFPETTDYVSIEKGIASSEEQARLRLRHAEDVVRVERCQSTPGSVQIFDRIVVRQNHMPEFASKEDLPKQFLSIYADRGLIISQTSQSVASEIADQRIAGLTDCIEGHPILKIQRTAYDGDGQPIEFCTRYCNMKNAEYLLDM